MDGRVLDIPWPIRFGVVNFAIVPKRSHESAHAYSTVWTKDGSPLIAISRRVQGLLQQRLSVPVELAMRYQNPSIDNAVRNLAAQGVTETFMIPLFPHWAMSSYETAVVRVQDALRKFAPGMTLEVMTAFYDHPDFIDALVASASDYLAKGYDHLLFSFHGLPERHIHKGDPTGKHCLKAQNCCEIPSEAHKTCYRAQCYKTVRDFVAKAGIPAGKFSVSFQSRLGKDPWIKPYTDEVLVTLPKNGVKKLIVLCPAFVSDCLETIEEIGVRGRDTFVEAGGETLSLVPCLNEHPKWISALENMVAARWPEAAKAGRPHAAVA